LYCFNKIIFYIIYKNKFYIIIIKISKKKIHILGFIK
jgi:hypothetical protein